MKTYQDYLNLTLDLQILVIVTGGKKFGFRRNGCPSASYSNQLFPPLEVGEGAFEVKIDVGPGYRVYFGEVSKAMILLLVGGDKNTQTKDIETAKQY